MEALIARAVQVLIALGGAYVLTLWFAIVVWTFQDIQARSRSVVAQIFSTLVVLIFSIPGLLVYMILRPRYTLDDAFQRSLEEEYLMQDLEELPLCPGCQQYVEDEWVFCPNCRTELRDNCVACDRLIDLRWEICPFCGTEQYIEDEDTLPAPAVQPAFAPSPQYLGRPQLTHAQIFQITSSEDYTRPIIPATVRVDLRNGSIAREEVPELPFSTVTHPFSGLGPPRRVLLDGNGLHDLLEQDSGRQPGAHSHYLDGDGAPAPQASSAPEQAGPATEIDMSAQDELVAESAPEPQVASPGNRSAGRKKRTRKRRSRKK